MKGQSCFHESRCPDTILFSSASFGTNPRLTEFAVTNRSGCVHCPEVSNVSVVHSDLSPKAIIFAMNVFRLGAFVLSLWSAATIHGAAAQVSFSVAPSEPLIDEPARIVVSGLAQ
jgi:hypothetical protein